MEAELNSKITYYLDAYQSRHTQAICSQSQMIRTHTTGCFVPILFAVEIRFHQPKQRFTVLIVFVAEH